MRNNSRTNKDQEVLDSHLKRAGRELEMAVRVLNTAGITRSEKRKLERQLAPVLHMVSRLKLQLPQIQVEEPKKKEKKQKAQKKEVKDVNGRR